MKRSKFNVLLVAGVLLVGVVAVSTIIQEIQHYRYSKAHKYSIRTWGANESGQLGSGKLGIDNSEVNAVSVEEHNVASLHAGLRHSVALTKDGKVKTWGSNEYGQIGNGKSGGSQVDPYSINSLPRITMVATRQDHTLALDDAGYVWAWGLNMSGQLGDTTNVNRSLPKKVEGLKDVVSIAAGYRSSLAIKKDGSVWVWGGNCNLQDMPNKTVAQLIASLSTGGYNDGTGGTMDHITPEDNCIQEEFLNIHSNVPIKVEGLPSIESASVGFGHSLAISTDGELWAWGCNRYGQIGTGKVGSQQENLKPIKIQTIGKVKNVSAGFRHSLAVTDDSYVWAWGHNYFGELGNGMHDELVYPAPSRVSALGKAKYIAAGHDFSLIVGTDHWLYGMGQNTFKQLGVSDNLIDKPKRLQEMDNVDLAAAGGGHTLVLFSETGE